MERVKRVLNDPIIIIVWILFRFKRVLPDKLVLQLLFYSKFQKFINFEKPKTYNEKLQWLKLYNRDPIYIKMVDKYEVKQYVSTKIGNEIIIPTLGIWKNFDEIDFKSLPDSFVLKCTHDSGSIIICKEKSKFDIDSAKKKLTRALKKNSYNVLREWPYKNVIPRIIAEKYLVDESGQELKDYKFFCFNGNVKLIQVDFDRHTKHKRNLYTPEWEFINAKIQYPNDPNKIIKKPFSLSNMLKTAEILSEGIPHARVDFYSIGTKYYFGELTFFHGGGLEDFIPFELGLELGSYIELPQKLK